jgi:hypothetical protein
VVDLHLELDHPAPTRLREVLSERFRLASPELNLLSSKVKIDKHLGLDFQLATDGPCTPEVARERLEKVSALATDAARLEVMRVLPDAAEALATALRARGLGVATPSDQPGRVTCESAPPADAISDFEVSRRVKVIHDSLTLWVVDPDAALTSDDMQRVSATRSGVDLAVRDELVARLAALTELRRPLPMLLDGTFIGAPLVASRASEGRLRLDLGGADGLAAKLSGATLGTAPIRRVASASCRN